MIFTEDPILDDDPPPIAIAHCVSTPTPVPSPVRSYWKTFAAIAAGVLTLVGACSDGAQKLFGSGQALGIDDLAGAISHSGDWLNQAAISYLLIGASAAFIQSICLEKDFTRELVEKALRVQSSSEESIDTSDHRALAIQALSLSWLEQIPLNLISVGGGAVRGISTIMGFYTIDNRLPLAISAPPALIDALQTLATEGQYLKDWYRLNRLWLHAQCHPARYTPLSLQQLRQAIDATDYPCTRTSGRLVYSLAMLCGSLAVLSDVGLAKLTIESCSELYGFDNDALAITLPKWFGLVSYFLLMSAIDSKSLANSLARRAEQSISSSSESMELNLTPQPITHPLLIAAASMVTLTGASLTGLGAYEGNTSLFTSWGLNPSRLTNAFNIAITLIKSCQSLAVEGAYTMKMAIDSHWRPACGLCKNPLSAFRSSSGEQRDALLPKTRLASYVSTL